MSLLAGRGDDARAVTSRTTKWTAVGRRWTLWLPLGLVALVGVVRLGMRLGIPFSSGGDVAFIELQLRQTLHGVVAVGPYSRFGWHNPGPAMFYLFAPLYWLSGGSSRSLFLSSWLLSMGSGLLTVLLARRRAGVMAGSVTALALLLFVMAVGFHSLIDPWNPSVLLVPMLLMVVSAAAAFDGDTWGVVALAASATFVMQTYIATVPEAAVFSLVGAAGYVRSRLRGRSSRPDTPGHATTRRRGSGSGVAMIGASSLVAVAWALPIRQQLRDNPGNLGLLSNFELHPPPTAGVSHHALSRAISVVSDYGTPFGLGDMSDIAAHWPRLALACGYAIVAVLACVWWAYHGDRFMAALAAATPIGLVVAIVAATRVAGPIYSYMFWWCRILPLPMVIASGTAVGRLVTGSSRGRPGWDRLTAGIGPTTMAAVGTAAMAAASIPALVTTATGAAASFPDSPGARLVAHQVEAAVGSRDRVFTIHIADQGYTDGPLILTLAKDGYRFHLTPEMDLYDGDTRRPDRGPTFTISHGNSSIPVVRATAVAAAPAGPRDLRLVLADR